MKANLKRCIALIFVLAIFVCATLINVIAISVDAENEYKYDEIIIPKIFSEEQLENSLYTITYHEMYEYFMPRQSDNSDENVPTYVLVYITSGVEGQMFAADVFGDYLLENYCHHYPFTYGYGIYIPSINEVYSLTYAYEMDVDGIEKVFTEYGLGRLIGDIDKDRKISIKDATSIQKCLAGISEFYDDVINAFEYEENPPLLYVSDFNRDCERNIKDATAIQKHLAKMDF